MNSLKSKFGKFAISQTEAKKVNGGNPIENLWFIADCGGSLYAAATYRELNSLIRTNGGSGAGGCTMLSYQSCLIYCNSVYSYELHLFTCN